MTRLNWDEEKRVLCGQGNMFPDRKIYAFWKRSAADVDITDDKGGDFFTYTPGFGEFKDKDTGKTIELYDYLEKYVKDNELIWCDVNIEYLRHCWYEVDPETFLDTLEFGEFKESSGIEGEYLEWNPETQEFDEREDEEDEEDE